METTSFKQLFASLPEIFSRTATVKKVYGEPIETQGKTIIPVAQVAFGFGGGFGDKNGKATAPSNPAEANGEGGGMGGGLSAKPIGFIEVTPNETRFVRINKGRYIALGALLGVTVSLLARRPRRKHQYPPL
ncbi:spore germination protein GerW family protein [Pontibacter liquoris]|uniref:spore germination protein GerW family protein n=1 Tax=Pontibacter liquoris TaxID=2905677 RepID=UPI001FA7864E|nr:spore germination protein GerW family protein [Pontibacter liquoris]